MSAADAARQIDLAGRVALVTGGGAGIGRGCAVGLAARGAAVVIADVDGERGERTAKEIQAAGGNAMAVGCDVMDTAQVGAAVQSTTDRHGRLDILVNNAGGVRSRRFLEQSERSWRRHLDINLTSALAATWHSAHAMIRGGQGGSIVNVASIEASRAAPTYAVYGAAKAGLVSFTRTMAVELGEHGIRVNCIAPDHTRTPGNAGIMSGLAEAPPRSPAAQAGIARYVPLGEEGEIEQCGDLVAFLSSPLAAYISGAVVPIDGGAWASSGWYRAEGGGRWQLYPGFGE